ncbi:MAG: hypothetical protein BGO26_17925 [Actinobacteria bacterium 69-20]|jgi:membrane protein YdbS with pleckstrin-like domain|nr:PH domain-containing protein [Actinomycetota bacterium]OJV24477.1 MAG: hypothetical protein BGO26_17925 [Actinobacteria bacterium 69-20]
MAFPDGLMSRGERVVVHKHPHWKVLVFPTVLFLAIVAALAFMIVWIGKWDDTGLTTHRWWYLAVSAVAAVLFVALCLVPYLRWATEHFVLTTAHVFFRTGILHRRQHQIPLIRVQNIETIVTFWGRIFGYGTLIVDSAADEPLEFSNVASLSHIQGTLNQLISDDRDRFPDPDLGDTRMTNRPSGEDQPEASGR